MNHMGGGFLWGGGGLGWGWGWGGGGGGGGGGGCFWMGGRGWFCWGGGGGGGGFVFWGGCWCWGGVFIGVHALLTLEGPFETAKRRSEGKLRGKESGEKSRKSGGKKIETVEEGGLTKKGEEH